MDDLQKEKSTEENTPKLRGLYRHVKISVKALDWIIVACIAVILVVFLLELPNLGFTVTYDSRGGTDVAPQTYMYGEQLEFPDPPTREGYQFTGWYTDVACDILWNVEEQTIETDMTLYAGWEILE